MWLLLWDGSQRLANVFPVVAAGSGKLAFFTGRTAAILSYVVTMMFAQCFMVLNVYQLYCVRQSWHDVGDDISSCGVCQVICSMLTDAQYDSHGV